MDKFNLIMDRVYTYDEDFSVGEIDTEYGVSLWLHINHNNINIRCNKIYIKTLLGNRVIKVREKGTNKKLCYTDKGESIEDLDSYCMLNASNVTEQIDKQFIYTEHKHFEEAIDIIKRKRKLWGNEYIQITYWKWEGLWDVGKQAWKIISDQISINIKSESTSDLDYIKLIEEGEEDTTYKLRVILEGFREVDFGSNTSIHRLSKDLWLSHVYRVDIESRYKILKIYRLLRLKEDNSIEQVLELAENEYTTINGINILACDLERGKFDIVDKYRNCIVSKPNMIIILEEFPDRIYFEYGDTYEVTNETLHGDKLTKCNGIRRNGLSVEWEGVYISCGMIYISSEAT